MTNWRAGTLFGASAAALPIVVTLFSGGKISEREVPSRIATTPAGTLAQEMAALLRRATRPPTGGDGSVEASGQDVASLARRASAYETEFLRRASR